MAGVGSHKLGSSLEPLLEPYSGSAPRLIRFGDGGDVRRAAGAFVADALDERIHTGAAHVGRGDRQWRQGHHLLVVHPETSAARGQHAHVRAPGDQPPRQHRDLVDHVLAVVDHEQTATRLEPVDDGVRGPGDALGTQPQRGRDGERDTRQPRHAAAPYQRCHQRSHDQPAQQRGGRRNCRRRAGSGEVAQGRDVGPAGEPRLVRGRDRLKTGGGSQSEIRAAV